MYKRSTIGIVIPSYNEEKLILKTLASIPSYVDKIYVTDDCSTDRTSELVLSVDDPRIELTRHNKNAGVGGAIITGFKKALRDNIDIVSVMAGDNQMDPKYLPRLLEPIIRGKTDFTKGNRLKRNYWKGMSSFRLFGNRLLSFINKIVSGYWNISDPQNGYVALSKVCLLKLDLDSLYKGYAFENDIMIKANVVNISMQNVPIPARYGEEKSKIKYRNFIIKTSAHLAKSYFWRMKEKYFKRISLVGTSLALGLLSLTTGLVWGTLTDFVNVLTLALPIISVFFLSFGFFVDGINGVTLSMPKTNPDPRKNLHNDKVPEYTREPLAYQQVYFK